VPKIRRKIFLLQFDDPALADYSIRVRSVSLGKILEVASDADRARAGAALAEVTGLLELFISRLESWNLTDETEDGDEFDVPMTLEGLYSLDVADALIIVLAWYDAMTGQIGESLGKASIDGRPSDLLSLPMAVG